VSSTFTGLSTALSALYAQRRGLDVTGQNIANANTDGYSRQRVNLESVGGSPTPALYSTAEATGGGVAVTDVARIRDAFLDARSRNEHAHGAYYTAQKQVYGAIEQTFNEPSDTGLQSQMSEYWSAWGDVANSPTSDAARTQLIQRGITAATTMNNLHNSLATLWSAQREQLDATVTDINASAASVAQLNKDILSAKQANLPSMNELADQRDKLVAHISELTGGSVHARENGTVDVYLNGSPLVSGLNARSLAVDGGRRLEDQAQEPVALRWTDNDSAASVASGSVASNLETLNGTLPTYSEKLDKVANALMTSVNDLHASGYDRNGDGGVDFFSGTGAADIAVAISDPAEVAASLTAGTADGAGADLIAGLADSKVGADYEYRQVVVNLGVEAQTVNRRADIQDTITSQVDAARDGQSGVSLDEEMTNMLQFQRAYQAASKVLSVIDDTLNTLINGIGVGS
jgi:flagellar hook-associated protein 1 FlgK